MAAKDGPAKQNETGDHAQPAELEQFEELTQRLLKVPKAELDAKLAEHRNGAKAPSRSTPRK